MRLTASLLCLMATGAAVRAEPQAPSLASHGALYLLRMADATGTKAPATAEGMISYHFSADCDFYAQTLRQAIDMQPQEGRRQVSESRVSTYEDGRGQDFRFATNETGSRGEEVEGRAQRSNGALAIALSAPRPQKISTDGAVLFPTQHVARLIEAAERGEKILLARVFDGSADGRKIFNVTAVIGAARNIVDGDPAANAPQLRGLKRWPVSLAYFPESVRDGLPDYTLSYDLYENGVSTNLRLDYGDYALVGALTRIEFPAQAHCRK
ncbi:hypothetical protein GGD83_000038 [Rhodoblastus sphagnicola]|nr:DUF1849 family protein [Rhodoblastus sphagnicola]MBB4196267.1 hypothetical protein [Rhodoblastus sphagnicola]